jgi:hypothetical protein
MVDTITAIMVEVLNILAITTKEIKQGRISKSLLWQVNFALVEPFSEKYFKRLIGRNDTADALERLDKLTQEARMAAAAQLLEITNAIDCEVGQIADGVDQIERL